MLLGDRILPSERLVALQVGLRLRQQALIVGQRALRLLQRRTVRPRVDLRQEVALLDHLAFLEADLLELAVDLRLHRHRVERCHGAQLVQDDADVALVDGGEADRLRGALCAASRRGAFRRLWGLVLGPEIPAATGQTGGDEAYQDPEAGPRTRRHRRRPRHRIGRNAWVRPVNTFVHRQSRPSSVGGCRQPPSG